MDGWHYVCVSFPMLHVCVNPFVLMRVYVWMGGVFLSLCLLICACDQMHISFCLYLCFTCVSEKQSISFGDSSRTPGQHRIVGKFDVTTIPIHHETDTNKDTHTLSLTTHAPYILSLTSAILTKWLDPELNLIPTSTLKPSLKCQTALWKCEENVLTTIVSKLKQ